MATAETYDEARRLWPIQDWHEDDGPVLWWRPPIEEPPYSGTPLDNDWPGYHTHFTLIVMPDDGGQETASAVPRQTRDDLGVQLPRKASREAAMTPTGIVDDDSAKGMYRKFDVVRVDGSSEPNGKHHGCEYFVIDVTHDPYAMAACLAYAEACRHDRPKMAADLWMRFLGSSSPPPSLRPPDYTPHVVAILKAADEDDRGFATVLDRAVDALRDFHESVTFTPAAASEPPPPSS